MMIRKFFKAKEAREAAKELKSSESRDSRVKDVPPPDGSLSLHHFILHDLLGEGAFGKVYCIN
jgi:serine/threonine kinase 32